MLLVPGPAVHSNFYAGTLGLRVLLETERFLTSGCGGNSGGAVTRSTTGTADAAPRAAGGWPTSPPRSPSSGRGVEIQDLPELGTAGGIADFGFALAAWFTDPHHNSLGLRPLK